jgi:murein DD-endopeptidase MepM/ murein hydrolase activator NlpD
MTEDKRKYTFLVIPQNSSKTYSFRLKSSLIFILLAVAMSFLMFFIYAAVVHQSLLTKARRAERLALENDILRAQAHKISELEGELDRLRNIRRHIYEMAGLSAGSLSEAGVATAKGSLVLSAEDQLPSSSEVSSVGLAEPSRKDSVEEGASYIPSLWPVRGWVTAEFNENMPGREKRHQGVDIAASHGTPILAAAAGAVAFSGWDKNLGLVIIIDHQNRLSTLYGHCSKVLMNVGEEVIQGQVVAHLGNTGLSSAPHLHFEIREDGIPVDPRSYLGP